MRGSMVKLVICIALALPAFADDASKTAKIQELFQLTHVDQIQKQMVQQMRSMVSTQVANTLPKSIPPETSREIAQDEDHMFDVIMSRVGWATLAPKMVQIYAETFSEDEIDAILAFYKSPAGQAFLDKMPTLMNKTMAITQENMQAIMPEIQRMSKEMVEKYAHRAQSGATETKP